MDSILIGQKLEALRHCITRIVEKCPANAALLAEDADLGQHRWPCNVTPFKPGPVRLS